MLGIGFGLAAVIIVLSVFNGFQDVTVNALTESSPSIRIYKPSEALSNLISHQQFVAVKEDKIVIKNNGGFDVAQKKEIYWLKSDTLPERYRYLQHSDPNRVTYFITRDYGVFGDTEVPLSYVELEQLEPGRSGMFGPSFNEMLVRPVGSDEPGTLIKSQAVTHITDLLDEKNIDYIEIYGIQDTDILGIQLESMGYSYETWEDLNKDLLSVLRLEKLFSSFVMFLIIGIGLFNLLAAMSMLITVKRLDFSILGVVGLSQYQKKKIVLFYGGVVIAVGIFLGLLLGASFVILQKSYGFIPIDIDGAVVDTLPVRLDILQILISLVLVILAGAATVWLPTTQIKTDLTYR
jgi:lipoprotein-releasing system permease protein